MKFESRSYAGELFRPKPIVHQEDGYNLIIVATAWGDPEIGERVMQSMLDYYTSARDDFEATAPFEKLSCLSMTANHLRTACLIGNELIYREANKAEYESGVEVLACVIEDQELVFAQVGLPYLLINRDKLGLMPLAASCDLSFDMSGGEKILPPLPNLMMGLDPTCNLTVNSVRHHPSDQIIMVSRSALPSTLFAQISGKTTLKQMSHILATDNVEMPFWLGIMET